MSREEFVKAMGGQESLDRDKLKLVECACGHDCCFGWNVEKVLA